MATPRGRRGDTWTARLAAAWSAAHVQAHIELALLPALTEAQATAQALRSEVRGMGAGDVAIAAVEGVGEGRFAAARARRNGTV